MRSTIIGSMFVLAVSGAGLGARAAAQTAAVGGQPEAVGEVQRCRTIADPAARLACYDQGVDRMTQAIASGNVVVAEREKIVQAKRGLFGLTLPDLGSLFGNNEDDQVNEISGRIASYSTDSSGRVRLVLEDGAQWQQVDTRKARAKSGAPVRIRRAALGSYLANIGEGTAIRVRRIVD